MQKTQFPIGIFDSGLGGLTIYKAIREKLPAEDLVYLGDTARVPYGSKSAGTVRQFSLQISRFLMDIPVKMIVVACNTASSAALNLLRKTLPVPVLGVIDPVAEKVVASECHSVAVIGTTGTINSNAYRNSLFERGFSGEITQNACPLFVPLVEEGWAEHPVTEMVAREYLQFIKEKSPESMILGCTHYPLLENTIRKVVGTRINIVDSPGIVAEQVRVVLNRENLVNTKEADGTQAFYLTDYPQKFEEISYHFLGQKLDNVQQIEVETLDKYTDRQR